MDTIQQWLKILFVCLFEDLMWLTYRHTDRLTYIARCIHDGPPSVKRYKIQAPSKVGILIVNAISKKPKYNYQNNYLIKHNNLSGFNNKYINKVL